jgi:phosphomannomutase
VVVNLTTSAAIDDIGARFGCAVLRSPVGEANVVERMMRSRAVIGGEGSNGGIIFPGVQYCRDSYFGMALILDRMAETGLPLSALAAELPRYFRKMGKSGFEHGRLGRMMQELQERLPGAEVDRSDGLKLKAPDGWIHVRASNTEPVLRIAAEAKTRERLEELYALGSGLA